MLVEIVAIVQSGLLTGTDVSQALRDIDVIPVVTLDGEEADLSPAYLQSRGRR